MPCRNNSCRLSGERSTYQETLLRLQGPMFAPPIVITGPDFHFFARRQAEEVGVCAVHGTNRSTPIGSVHRLANRGRILLELIEVQTGSYFGEDDIVSLEDVFRRS